MKGRKQKSQSTYLQIQKSGSVAQKAVSVDRKNSHYNHFCTVRRAQTISHSCKWKDCSTSCATRDHITTWSHLCGKVLLQFFPEITLSSLLQSTRHSNPIFARSLCRPDSILTSISSIRSTESPSSFHKTWRSLRKYTQKNVISSI